MAEQKRIWLPRTAEQRTLRCLSCGAMFYGDQVRQYKAHVVACSSQHEHLERAMSLRQQLGPVFGGEMVDVELETWVKQRAAAIMEGRTKL